jgi:hypothetical protein
MSKSKRCSNIRYRCYKCANTQKLKKSIKVYGLDTEAYDTGRCFLICTSEGDAWKISDFPRCLFSRKYQNANFVCYNLKYDSSAILQILNEKELQVLREKEVVYKDDYKIKIIANKCLTVSKKGHTVNFYDMYNFYGGSLDYNAQKYLGKKKHDMETKSFSFDYVSANLQKITNYCIQDAVLVKELAELIINKFEDFGVFVTKLYSTAYVSFQYFRKNTNYQTVSDIWKQDKKLLDFALESYNGGKFEVTQKGTGYFYEYDIVSAYPFEIANLVSLEHCRIVWDVRYKKTAVYGFLKCKLEINVKTFSPVALKTNNTCIFYAGKIEKVLTKNEYDYLLAQGSKIEILEAVWIFQDNKVYPYKKEIIKLVEKKKQYKIEGKELDYHTVKIFLNSLYGKFVQLIETNQGYTASTCWNPIYAAIITANCRIRVTLLQQLYPSIVAVHTDSVISTKKLDINIGKNLGEIDFECEGQGLIIGSGIYQIGKKIRFRGMQFHLDLFELFDQKKKTIKISQIHVNTWRECAFHGWSNEEINKFVDVMRELRVDFDQKRIWIDDYKYFSEIFSRNVNSLPLWYDLF